MEVGKLILLLGILSTTACAGVEQMQERIEFLENRVRQYEQGSESVFLNQKIANRTVQKMIRTCNETRDCNIDENCENGICESDPIKAAQCLPDLKGNDYD